MSKVKDFKKDTLHEIEMLKQHATDEEKARLNFEDFNYESEYNCIYGQLTGRCDSPRAKELMDLACIRVMGLASGIDNIQNRNISDDAFVINGANTGQGWTENGYRKYKHLSALEAYIGTKRAKNKEILEYIKGNLNKLTL